MTKSSPSDTRQEQSSQEQPAHRDRKDHGRTGEGAASAMQQLISQDQRHRHQNGEPEEPSAGSVHP